MEIDKVWNKISSIILNSCIEGMPHFWISSDNKHKCKKKKKRLQTKNHIHTAKLIQLWYSRLRPNLNQPGNEQSFKMDWERKISKYNNDYDQVDNLEIPDQSTFEISTDNIFTDEWFAHLLCQIKERKKLDYKIYLQHTQLQIVCKIESKFEMIQTHQSIWLNNSLEKHRLDVKIDRAVIPNPQDSAENILILEPNEVKQVAADTFAHQFRKRRTMFDSLNPFWT